MRCLAPIALCLASPLAAQEIDHSAPGAHAAYGDPAPKPPADPHTGHHLPPAPRPTDPAGKRAPPSVPDDHYADRFFPPAEMARVREQLRREHGGGRFSRLMIDIAEFRPRSGHDEYHWNGEAWTGGDIHRFIVKSEGEGAFGDKLESGEVQLLYGRAVDPYWNVQAGLRRDLGHRSKRTYAAMAIEGLAPYWFEIEASLFLSDKGDLLARFEAYTDERITNRLILQPRIEANFAAQDMRDERIGAGISDVELGLRLRFELLREFAPYIGIVHERSFGATARQARTEGRPARKTMMVVGLRAWF